MGAGGGGGAREAGTEGESSFMMRPLLLRSSLGCFGTVFGSFSHFRNKLVAQAAAAPQLYYLRQTMHYQTVERGRPNSPDYRIYFSKFIIAIMAETCAPPVCRGVTQLSVTHGV